MNGLGLGPVTHSAMSVRQVAQRSRSSVRRNGPSFCGTSAGHGAQHGPQLAGCYQQHFTHSGVPWRAMEEEGRRLSVMRSASWSSRSSRPPRESCSRVGRTIPAPTAAGSSSKNIHNGTWLWVKEAVLLPRVSGLVDGDPMALGSDD